ncbi:hypothetical protein AKI39_17650 [Bordetella sp. H567]|uniref:hypothetical protein n=1 Tax=Bordetella sp. H567 TaxID=1697043 RepID=UPI00081CB869|nr:hypothetical protein [Bordetella sp. H567]AOB32148.1 hypothetical protein AKI39_17650 [Bordetella sp. H567]
MSNTSTAVAAASPLTLERAGMGRALCGLLAAPFVALWKSWSTPDTFFDVREYSDGELADMGVSPEMRAEAQALQEFEYSRAYAMSLYYW